MQEPLHGELGQLQELDQSRVHRALAALAALAVQAAEGHRADVLLQGVHIQPAHHRVDVHRVDAPPVHALLSRAELEGEDGGDAAGWSHAWCRGLAEGGVQEGGDPRR